MPLFLQDYLYFGVLASCVLIWIGQGNYDYVGELFSMETFEYYPFESRHLWGYFYNSILHTVGCWGHIFQEMGFCPLLDCP